jgi:hypothetical protein
MIPLTTIPIIHPQVAARPLEDKELLLLADAGEVLVLNEAGALIWQGVEAGATVRELVAVLAAHYTLDETRAAADVESLLEALAAAGALELAGTVTSEPVTP